jgi:hypothetical protein
MTPARRLKATWLPANHRYAMKSFVSRHQSPAGFSLALITQADNMVVNQLRNERPVE